MRALTPFALLALCAVAAVPAFAVDLTPRYIDTFIDGITSHRLYFADGDKKIGVSVDRETAIESGAGGAVFRFPKFSDALFILKHSPMSADQPFQGVTLERYREAARRLLPPGAQEIKVLAEQPDPIVINRWRSYRFMFSCQTATESRMLGVTFLNIDPEEQLLLLTSASEKNFKEAAERSWQIIRTWQPLLPGDEKPPRAN